MNQYLCYYTVGQTPNLIIGHKYIKAYSEGEAKIKIFEIDLLTSKERIRKRDGDRFLHFMSGYHKRIKVVIDYINENYKDKLI